jgi:hypothetical protein
MAAEMNFLKSILRLLRRGLILLLITYWAVFISYTIKNLLVGGPGALVIWYRHISNTLFYWSWGKFVVQQAGILLLTLGLGLSERGSPSRAPGNPMAVHPRRS